MNIVVPVHEGEAGALAATVHQGRGSSSSYLGVGNLGGWNLSCRLLINIIVKIIVQSVSKNNIGQE